jgi:hypothetical protein
VEGMEVDTDCGIASISSLTPNLYGVLPIFFRHGHGLVDFGIVRSLFLNRDILY